MQIRNSFKVWEPSTLAPIVSLVERMLNSYLTRIWMKPKTRYPHLNDHSISVSFVCKTATLISRNIWQVWYE